ncbi:MAG: O-antigen ligase family protein [Paracoccaceae bacterium]|jgi:O-antigen ligase|nr:O-antigen ligase family protein [Paracoccaceae bacterium]MDP7185521.1 O-antigen ligase family protein [Paracoccaceae bacterium]
MAGFSTVDARTRQFNRFLAAVILLVLLASPMMIGSNRPVFWMLNTAVLSAVTAVFLLLVNFGVVKMRVSFSRWRLFGTLAAIYLLGLVAQLVLASVTAPERFHSPGDILTGLLRVVSYGCLLLLSLQVTTNVGRARKFAWGVFGVTILIAIYALVSRQVPELLFYEKDVYVDALSGPFINRNSFATYLAFGSALGTALVLRNDREDTMSQRRGRMDVEMVIGRLVVFVAVLLLFACILASGSRMGAFVGLLGILVPVVLRVTQSDRSSGSRQALVGLALAVVALLAFALVSAAYGGLVFDRLGSTGMSADVRWNLYENVFAVALQRPFLGYGFDSFELAFRMGHELPVSPDLRWQNAHNTYLELWVELGFILGSIPPFLTGLVLFRLLRRGAENQYSGYLAQAAVSAIIIAAIHSLVDFSLEIEANVFLFLVIIALGLAPNDSKVKASK